MSSIEDRIRRSRRPPHRAVHEGHPQFPMCGFSSRAVQAPGAAGANPMHTVNVLEEPEIRANLPRYSDWPTFPAVHQRRADRRLRHYRRAG